MGADLGVGLVRRKLERHEVHGISSRNGLLSVVCDFFLNPELLLDPASGHFILLSTCAMVARGFRRRLLRQLRPMAAPIRLRLSPSARQGVLRHPPATR